MRDDEEAPLEDEIAIEQLAEELWQKTARGTVADWRALSVLQKQAWRNRARMEVTIWRKKVGQP
jgi:hypothetical protein